MQTLTRNNLKQLIKECVIRVANERMLAENLSVNNEVLAFTDIVCDRFRELASKTKFTVTPQTWFSKKKYRFGKVVFSENFLGNELKFIFNCLNIPSKNDFKFVKENYGLGSGFFTFEDNSITVNLALVGETIEQGKTLVMPDPRPLVAHEILHAFQYAKNKKMPTQDYNVAVNYEPGFLSKRLRPEYITKKEQIADIIYKLNDGEIDAYATTAFLHLKYYVGNNDPREYVKKTGIYKFYKACKNVLELIENDRNGYEKIINKFGYTYEGFLRRYKKQLKICFRKIGKILARFESEQNESGT